MAGEKTECWLIDLDGVVWLSDDPIPGAAGAIAALRAHGRRVAFFTNNSFSSRPEMLAKFARHAIPTVSDDLLSSAQAAAALLSPGSRAAVLGGAGIVEALGDRSVEVVPLESVLGGAAVDALVVGLDRTLSFERLTAGCRAVGAGAAFIATNDDATYPTPTGVLPGGGALVAAVRYTTRTDPVVAGKPNPPAVSLVKSVLGEVDYVVGDRPETDGALAYALGSRFALVRTGVTPAGATVDPPPNLDGSDLVAIVSEVLGLTRTQVLSFSDVHS